MDDGEAEQTTTQVEPSPEDQPPDVPLLFSCALWVPAFAVVLWFMLRLFGPRPIVPEADSGA